MDQQWRQLDKGRQQQQPHTTQLSKTTSADHNSTTKQHITEPIQSIANVLNYHSKSVHQQKKLQHLETQDKNRPDQTPENAIVARHFQQQKQKGNASSQGSGCSPIAHSYNQQVDQGNSYLYAYNDFITSTRALNNRDLKFSPSNLKRISAEEKLVEESDFAEIHENICNHNLPKIQIRNQESLIESDEDDALSYILHQHRPHELLHDFNYLVSGRDPHKYNNPGHPHHQFLSYEGNLNSFEPQGIDHHLSCSRSSHPRHICGIGGSHNDKLNHIAARLREESQRAFLLNQKPRNSDCLHNYSRKLIDDNDVAAIQSRQFTNELKSIHNQLANSSLEVNNQQYNGIELSETVSPKTSYLNSNIDLNINLGTLDNSAVDRESLLLEQRENSKTGIIVYSESSDQSQNSLNQGASRASRKLHKNNNRPDKGYFSWLIYSLLSIISPSSQQLNRIDFTNKASSAKRGRRKRANEPQIVSMYSASQQVGSVGQLGGQAGAYYTTQTPQTDSLHHQSYPNHPHNAHHHHYPLSSDSSMSSSAFANSALRLNTFFRSCCSKKCLFVFCLMLILLIFIFVIGLSAYLNFLINLNRTNLTPLSGRLKVDTQGDSFNDQLSNRTSIEFLAKQQQYEIILRGAFDRTQNLLKSYPNHLVKCEVYSFKQGSLWVYFRLFINKRTLLQDTQLMKRKSPDEHLDKQFLPRLTQQTLHAGFEQLITAFNKDNLSERRSRSSQTADLRQPRAVPFEAKNSLSTQYDHVKSFDDQISRLMPIIESVDLQSIQVTPEFDMLQTGNSPIQQQSMSDKLRTPTLLTTASVPVLVATGSSNPTEYDVAQTTPPSSSTSKATPTSSTRQQDIEPPRTSYPDEVNVSTRKFTLYGYKENATRPATSSRPVVGPSIKPQEPQDSLFLVNHSRKPVTVLPKAKTEIESSTNTQNKTTISVIESQSSAPKEKVVKLVSGQPVVSQNNFLRTNTQTQNSEEKLKNNNANARNITLFAPLSKLEQFLDNNSNIKILEASANGTHKNKVVNETVVTPMIAPYQKIEFSTSPVRDSSENSNTARRPVQDISIQDLWNNALNGKKNVTIKIEKPEGGQSSSSSQQQQQPNRLITVTTIGAGKNQEPSNSSSPGSSLDWHKISILSSDISDTIRAHLNGSSIMTSTTAMPIVSVTTMKQRPKVSPHLKQGGSLISPLRQQEPQSAVILNRDFQHQANNDEGHSFGSTSALAQQTSTTPATTSRLSSQSRSDRQQRKPSNGQRNNISGPFDQQKQRNPKPTIMKNKVKKVTDQSLQSKNETTLSPNAKDNLTSDSSQANVDSGANKVIHQTNPSINQRQNQRNKTQENFSFNSDHLVPTLPTTIELTRSTSVGPISRTTHLQPSTISDGLNDQRSASTIDYTTTSSSPQKSTAAPRTSTTELPVRIISMPSTFDTPNQNISTGNFVVNNSLSDRQNPAQISLFGGSSNKPGTTNFSNQWRPISNTNSSLNSTVEEPRVSNRASTKKPNMSLIIGTERIPQTLNAPSSQGSRSPFAMSTAILENQLKPAGNRGLSQSGSRKLSKLSNTYQVVNIGSNGNNEFESHRMSRMRQNGNSNLLSNSQTHSSTSTMSSLNLDPATRIVDDFMITTDRMDDNTRGATLLPPLVVSSLQRIDPVNKIKTLDSVDVQPKRTRGPFAFETLKSFSGLSALTTPGEFSEPSSTRPERSPDKLYGADHKLLVRKKLFIGSGEDDEIVSPSSMNPLSETKDLDTESGLDKFGNRRSLEPPRIQDSHNPMIGGFLANQSHRCSYYGCKAKGSLKFTCLNYTQICDDFIDCQDESDELDCVSLLKHDSKTNKLSFSNGGGIIYLNRRGSLAPMCIDYFGEIENQRFSSLSLDPDEDQIESIKKQQELIRQINTIGQYACSLQSFSRLVSVKINHNNLVDDMNLIRSSKLFHRLSILGDKDKHDRR